MAVFQAKNEAQSLILSEIRRNAPVTRSELARRTGYTPATVTHAVASLLSFGIVEELGRRQQSRGQPPIELRIRPQAAYSIGAHLEHREISCVLADADGTALAKHSEVIEPGNSSEVLARLERACADLLEAVDIDRGRLMGVGLAAFGPIDLQKGTVSPPIYAEDWLAVPVRDALAQALGLPVYLDNNATAAAIGEHWYGAARPFQNFLHIFLGFGLGGGLFLGGRVFRGTSGNAGEVGHMIVDMPGRPWFRGSPGSLESEVSLLSLERRIGPFQPADLLPRFEIGDAELLGWLEAGSRRLAQVAVSVDQLLDLEAIILGGLLPSAILDFLLERVRGHIDRLEMSSRAHRAQLLAGKIGAESPALGAATLPIYDAFLPAPNAGTPSPGLFANPL